MLKTFNAGIGLVLVVDADRAEALTEVLADAGETVHRIGIVDDTETIHYAGTLL